MAVSAILPAEPPAGGPTLVAGPLGGGSVGSVQRVVLTGFMGSGKSTVGRLLAGHLGWSFSDLDASIEARLGLTVPNIFAMHGESAFRAAEVEDLGPLLRQFRQVISLGGGAPGTPEIRNLLRTSPATIVIHLQAPFPELYRRCLLQAEDPHATDRPLLGTAEAAGLRYQERLTLYRSIAHWTAETAETSPAMVTEGILDYLADRLA